jgi:hypothetical protein
MISRNSAKTYFLGETVSRELNVYERAYFKEKDSIGKVLVGSKLNMNYKAFYSKLYEKTSKIFIKPYVFGFCEIKYFLLFINNEYYACVKKLIITSEDISSSFNQNVNQKIQDLKSSNCFKNIIFSAKKSNLESFIKTCDIITKCIVAPKDINSFYSTDFFIENEHISKIFTRKNLGLS